MKYHVDLFGLELEISKVAFTIPIGDGIDIYWYGILISLGFLLALLYAFRRAKDFKVNSDRLIDCVIVSSLFAIAGARAYFLIFKNGITGLKDFFNVRDGGLAIYGGIIMAVIAGYVMCRIRKLKFADVLDLAAPSFLIGQAIGRWGNFFNQEAFGNVIPENSILPSWWGMSSEQTFGRVHPCFLYESLWCVVGFIMIHMISKERKFSGQLAMIYGIWYGIGRFFIEGLRTDSLFIGAFRVSQIVSLALVIACSILLVVFAKRAEKKEAAPISETTESEYVSILDEDAKAQVTEELEDENGSTMSGEIPEFSEEDEGEYNGEDN